MAEGGQGGNDTDGIFVGLLVFVILGVGVYAVYIFFPKVFTIPFYYLTLTEAFLSKYLMFGLNDIINAEYNYISDRTPDYFTGSTIFTLAFSGHWYPLWVLMFSSTALLAYKATTKHGRYRVGKDVELTPKWLIDNLDPWYPHLSPLQIIDPLEYPSKNGLLDFSEWPEEWAIKNKIVPTCKCEDIMYEWPEIEGWSCEESMMHTETGGCRHRQRTAPNGFELSDQGFLDIRCLKLLKKQLTIDSFGLWVDEDTLFKRNKIAYIVLAASYAAGSGNRDNALELLGNLSYSIEKNISKGSKEKPFRMNSKIFNETLKSAKVMMKKHTSGKKSDMESYLYIKGIHAFDTTHIGHAFLRGGEFGVFNSGILSAILKLFDRNLYYIISQVGRSTSFVEVTGIYEHMQHEILLHSPIKEPMIEESYMAIKSQLGYRWSKGKHEDE